MVLKPLILKDLGDGRDFMLQEDFTVLCDDHTYTAPKDSVTDGASVPRLLWRVVGSPFTGKYRGPAVIHDACYRQTCTIDHIPITLNPISRKDADRVFLNMMKDAGVGWFRRHAIHLGVRCGGHGSWQGPKGKKIW